MNKQDENNTLFRFSANCKALWPDRLSSGLIGLLAIGLTSYRTPCASAVADGLSLCANTLLPALFPFFVLSGLIVETGLAQRAGACFAKPMSRWFHLPGSSASLFLLGALGSYPTGARAVSQLYQQGLCTKEEAQRMLGFCNHCGPGFFLGVVGGTLLGSITAGLVLWLIHLAAALAVAFLFRGRHTTPIKDPLPFTPLSLPRALVKSVSGAMQSTLGVCGFVLFFSVLLCLLQESGVLPLVSSIFHIFGQDQVFAHALSAGLLEISCGVTALSASTAALSIKGAAAVFLLSFGGCSVLFQTMQQTEDTGLSLGFALRCKLLQAILAAAVSYLYLRFLFESTATFLPITPTSPLLQTGLSGAAYLLFCLFALAKGRKSRYNKTSLRKGGKLHDLR